MKIVLLAEKSKEKRMKVRVPAKFRHKELSELCQHNLVSTYVSEWYLSGIKQDLGLETDIKP